MSHMPYYKPLTLEHEKRIRQNVFCQIASAPGDIPALLYTIDALRAQLPGSECNFGGLCSKCPHEVGCVITYDCECCGAEMLKKSLLDIVDIEHIMICHTCYSEYLPSFE